MDEDNMILAQNTIPEYKKTKQSYKTWNKKPHKCRWMEKVKILLISGKRRGGL
jgi:hypothetical protein